MAAPAFRAISTAGGSAAANITGTEPTGAAENDILVAHLYIESDTAVTAPSGWSNSFNGATMLAECNTAGRAFRSYAYWIRRGASAPALTWTFLSSFRGLSIAAYSGALASGDPWSFGTTAVRDDETAATFPAVSGTTTDADEKLVWMGGDFIGGTASVPPTDFNERLDAGAAPGGDLVAADKDQAAAGATGSITGASYTGSNGTTTALMGGLRPVAAAGDPIRLRFPPQLEGAGAGGMTGGSRVH